MDILVATTGAQDFIYINSFYGVVDTDGDGVPDNEDPNPTNPYICGDSDNDGCDDCAVMGYFSPNNDGLDTDGDGLCDLGDPDIDGDGMPNEWESLNGTNPLIADGHLDADGDGVSNYNEYVMGSNPQSNTSVGQTLTSLILAGQWNLRFTAKRAEGPGYTGKTRLFTVVKSDILGSPGIWVPVSGYTNILGNNQEVIVSGLTSTGSSPHIYRLEIDLD